MARGFYHKETSRKAQRGRRMERDGRIEEEALYEVFGWRDQSKRRRGRAGGVHELHSRGIR